jgi:serine protease AprX
MIVNPTDDIIPAGPAPSEDYFEFGQGDLTADRRVPVLITFPKSVKSTCPSQTACPHINLDERLELPLVNGFSTYVDPKNLQSLADFFPNGTSLTLNNKVRFPDFPQLMSDEEMVPEGGVGRVERLPNIEKVWARGFTGEGKKIVIIDSGIHPHADLKKKVVEWVDFSKQKNQKMMDDYGHGTHVAGVAAGDGAKSNGEISGIAPDAEIVGLRITTKAEAIRALQWCVENKERLDLDVVNMSLGEVARRGHKFDPWAVAVQKASEAGLTVVVAAGNEGPEPGSVSTPGIHPSAITVGAYDSKGTPQLDDDTVWRKSSQGPTIDGLKKPDVLAPGVAIFGPLAPKSHLDNEALPHRGRDYFAISGTSQATPMISGLISILKQANPNLDTASIKGILKQASGEAPVHPTLGAPAPDGAGLVDAERALDLALAMGNPKPTAA